MRTRNGPAVSQRSAADMLEHTHLGPGKMPIVPAILVLTAAILLGVCAAAPAMRPRTTPARAAAQAAIAERTAPRGAAEVARHDAMISRILARHDGASMFAAPRVHTAFAGRGRLAG